MVMNPGGPQNLQQFVACVVIVIHNPPPTPQLDAYYNLQGSHLASQKIYFQHPHFPSKPFLDCLGQACTHKPIAQKKNIIKNLILSLVLLSLPCGIANRPKKKIASQNPPLTFQVCAEFPWLCTICCGCTPCYLKDISQAFIPVHYLLLHTLLLQSSFHGFALSAAAAHQLVQKMRYLIHDSTGLAPQHKNQS
jgi:hypothetical protein